MRTFGARCRGDGQRATGDGLALALALSLSPLVLHAQAGTKFGDLKAFFSQAVHEEGIVGAGLYIVSPNGVVDSAFAGYADRDSGRKANGATIWHWASITKTFTAIAIMQLRDRGRLAIDDPILTYVPELAEVHNPYGPMSQVTIRQLLSHSAGFRSGTWPWGGEKEWHPFEPTKWSQLVAMMPYTDIQFQPGSKFQYSNPGYVFLGEAITRLAGEDFEVYMHKNVLSPLGMTHSYYDTTPWHLIGDRSNNYSVKDGKAVANGLDFDTGITTSNGGLNAPLSDMALYLRFLIGGQAGGRAGGQYPLPRSSLEEMWNPVVSTGNSGSRKGSVGLGYFITEYPDGDRMIGHTGSQAAFRSLFWVHPGSRTAMIAVFNTAPDPEGAEAKPRIGKVFTGLNDRFEAAVRCASTC
jgi:CubicO group peptidase (beta-lactamase class C family)